MAELTRNRIETLRKQLRQRHAELREEIREELMASDSETYADLAGRVHDEGEESVADLLVDVSLERINMQVNEVRRIEDALQRIAEGTYGVCEECGESIRFERLKVQPAAARCIDCQREYERSQPQHATL